VQVAYVMSSAERRALYLRRQIQTLLEWIINGHAKIEPSWIHESRVYRYSELDNLLGSPVAGLLLEELASKGLLKRYTVDDMIECPKCHSPDELRDRYLCLFCDSSDLRKGTLIEHYNCGHVDFAESFRGDGGLMCPKCDRVLKLLGTDYRRIDGMYRCQSCKRDSSVPKVVHVCTRCNQQFDYNQADVRPVYGYEFVEEFRGEVVANCTFETPLTEFLKKMGYSVEARKILTGLSGVEHVFDVFGERGDERIVIAIASDPKGVEEQTVANFFAKVYDVQPTRSILIAMPALRPRAKRLADLYKIEAFDGEDLNKIMEQMKNSSIASKQIENAEKMIAKQGTAKDAQRAKASVMPEVQQEKVSSDATQNSIPKTAIESSTKARHHPGKTQATDSEFVKCPACGRPLARESRYCDSCGKHLSAGTAK
jgi:hypothetical protein